MTDTSLFDGFAPAGDGPFAHISDCKTYRYMLRRRVSDAGPVYLFVGVNPSTADANVDDATVRKWRGFVSRWGGSGFYVGNVFAYRSTDVRGLMSAGDPFGPDRLYHIDRMIEASDIVVPCWGDRRKLPQQLRPAFGRTLTHLRASGRPIRHLGLTKGGDPRHPLMLGYDTPLEDWQ